MDNELSSHLNGVADNTTYQDNITSSERAKAPNPERIVNLELFKRQFINAKEILGDYKNSTALEDIKETHIPYYTDFFISTALDRNNIELYYLRLCNAVSGDNDHILCPEDAGETNDPDLKTLNTKNIKGLAEKFTNKLHAKDSTQWHDITDPESQKKFEQKYLNAAEVMTELLTQNTLTRDYPGYPNTHIIMKCFARTALNPKDFDTNYLQMVRDFNQFGIEKYPSIKKVGALFEPRLEALKVNFDLNPSHYFSNPEH